MHRNSHCRHPVPEPIIAPASISTVAERVRSERPAVANGTELPRLALPQVPHPARPQVVVMSVFMQLTAPLQALPQWPPQVPIALQIPELEAHAIKELNA